MCPSGYDKLDVYTFQSEFIKIYKWATAKKVMSDVLKNNHLEGAALSLVLKKKLFKINKISQLPKLIHTEKAGAALNQIINIMKDL